MTRNSKKGNEVEVQLRKRSWIKAKKESESVVEIKEVRVKTATARKRSVAVTDQVARPVLPPHHPAKDPQGLQVAVLPPLPAQLQVDHPPHPCTKRKIKPLSRLRHPEEILEKETEARPLLDDKEEVGVVVVMVKN